MDKNKLIIHIDNTRSRIENLPSGMAGIISKEFEVPFPNYWFSPRYKNGSWDGKYRFFQRPANSFPTGLLPLVVNLLKENNFEFELDDQRTFVNKFIMSPVPDDYKISETKESRDYQIDTINKTLVSNIEGLPFIRGVINIATNGGKTSVAEAIMKEIYPILESENKNFLFVTHSKEIAYQAKKSIENDLKIEVGFIGDGKWDIKTITIALIPTLYKRVTKPEFQELVKTTVGFIGDEIHHSSSNSWYETLFKFKNAAIRIGLTGTVDKENQINEYRLYSCTGPIINKISNKYLIDNGYSAKPNCILFDVTSPELEGEIYSEAYQLGIVESEERNSYIVKICKKETNNNNNVLILVEHISHGETLKEELEKLDKKVIFTNGQLSSEERNSILEGLKNGEIDVLISTAILDEGVDVSNINAVIYARGMKSTRKLLQGIGRGLRKKKDGSQLRFYDFIDDTHSALLQHSLSRYKVLKAEGFQIKKLDIETYINTKLEEL